MIEASSRYAQSVPFATLDSRDRSVAYAIFRSIPPETTQGRFKWHLWKESDRWDLLAVQYLNNPALWYRLLDFNPSISDPHSVEPGQPIIIPVGMVS